MSPMQPPQDERADESPAYSHVEFWRGRSGDLVCRVVYADERLADEFLTFNDLSLVGLIRGLRRMSADSQGESATGRDDGGHSFQNERGQHPAPESRPRPLGAQNGPRARKGRAANGVPPCDVLAEAAAVVRGAWPEAGDMGEDGDG